MGRGDDGLVIGAAAAAASAAIDSGFFLYSRWAAFPELVALVHHGDRCEHERSDGRTSLRLSVFLRVRFLLRGCVLTWRHCGCRVSGRRKTDRSFQFSAEAVVKDCCAPADATMRLAAFFLLLALPAIVSLVAANELSRCCGGGSRHYGQTKTCTNIRTEGSSNTCLRAANICCLRALLDDRCDEGARQARDEEYCPARINELGGGFKKECCDCCLLAKDLARKNEPCVAPTGFSASCLKAFNRCCSGPYEFTYSGASQLTSDRPTGPGLMSVIERPGDRCSQSRCEHLCNDRGGSSVECSCRSGFELAADGRSCIDKDECAEGSGSGLYSDICGFEMCQNTPGGYLCLPPTSRRALADTSDCPSGHTRRRDGHCVDVDECSTPLSLGVCLGEHEQCMNTVGSFSCACLPGYYWSDPSETCVDVDECLLLAEDCVEGQRCLNTPGSYKCIRTLGCGTGYALDTDTEQCMDVDECNLGTHDCGAQYNCRNTQGSYRCDPKSCGNGELMNPLTGECKSIDCPIGFRPSSNGPCEDVNECEQSFRCQQFEECINTPGSYRCQEKGNFCTSGYQVDRNTGFCIDIDECTTGTHACGSQQCINTEGSYRCRCPAGYEFSDATKRCEDMDECEKFEGHVCSYDATCENVPGSFRCHCKPGFRLAADQRNCEDVDECSTSEQKCQQKCVNIPGSYQCICDRGYTLGVDGITCEDIDECSVWSGSGEDLCMGGCENTPGSYRCKCPDGYIIQPDGRTCKDVDECSQGQCQDSDRICVNTLGSFKCHTVQCPPNYVHDRNFKNRCNRAKQLCSSIDTQCRKQPVHISWQYIAIPRMIQFNSQRTSVNLFTVKGPSIASTSVQFELILRDARPERANVALATRSNFLLQKGDDRNSAIVALRDPLDGPQEVHLELILRVHHIGNFGGKYVANLHVFVTVDDGYACLKQCFPTDHICIGNHTKAIFYQFSALPSMNYVKQPVEVTRIRAEMDAPFSVEYVIDRANAMNFAVEQDRHIGIVKLIAPIRGPVTEIVRLHINTKSRTNVLIAHNVAFIEVHVSRYFY
uniref:EGF-like domain-containing protein n=1 Tax=Plectus sambesii TaxID=2011161 RepID=A0A914WJH8_9BILA